MKNLILFITAVLFYSTTFSQSQEVKEIVTKATATIRVNQPEHMDPVTIGAAIVDSDKEDEKIVVLKTKIMPGYHIYAYVPSGTAYITSEVGVDLPKDIELVGDWGKSSPEPYPGKQNILVYKNENTFYHSIKINPSRKGTKITCWLYYQCCDANICFPPQKKEVELTL